MKYKGYKIVISYPATHFYEIENDRQGKQLDGISYHADETPWYSVIDEDNWCAQTFETIEECKEYIDEEVEQNGVAVA